MNQGTKNRIYGLLKGVGLAALFAVGMNEQPESRPGQTEREEKIADYQRRQGCTEEQIERYKRDGTPPYCSPEQD
ncbi:MAG: hypothetical protein KDI90_10395 [Alphaproteobacteria bacterium]|nr:hypothetical protein [Alphaproteobacteria bacterium]MCB9974331.1 hypothetical protein [Rhodospirillales bacterium]